MTIRPAVLTVAVAGLAVFCGCQQPEERIRPPHAASPHPCRSCPAPVRSEARTVTIGKSAEGRPIVLHLFGKSKDVTFIFAGIHGDEPTSRRVAERLIAYLKATPSAWHGRSVAVMPAVNPDGLARGTRQNARGVDCNRNFPARNWSASRPGSRYYGGPSPLSEPETRAVAAVVECYKPRRIISIHSISGDRHCNNYDGPGEALARAMAEGNGYPPKASIGYPTPGSFGSWAGVDKGTPTVTLELPCDRPASAVWSGNLKALLAAIRRSDNLAR